MTHPGGAGGSGAGVFDSELAAEGIFETFTQAIPGSGAEGVDWCSLCNDTINFLNGIRKPIQDVSVVNWKLWLAKQALDAVIGGLHRYTDAHCRQAAATRTAWR